MYLQSICYEQMWGKKVMEFHEKLQELRKSKGMTQEELADALYVSRTAISKWESKRGYPSIDSLKEISDYFGISIDDLLSADKVINIAKNEKKSVIQSMFDSLFGMVDILAVTLIVLPLYPKTVDGYIYSINLFEYNETTKLNLTLYWLFYAAMILVGIVKVMMSHFKITKGQSWATYFSITVGFLCVIFLSMTKEAYAVVMAILLLSVKVVLIIKRLKIAK